jgi:hypothetical protein
MRDSQLSRVLGIQVKPGRFASIILLAASGLVASCAAPNSLPPPGAAPTAEQVLESEKQAAAHSVSRCLFQEAVARDNHESSLRTIAKRVVEPCRPQFEAMLQVEEKGLNQPDAVSFDKAMRRQELNIATMEVAAARQRSSRQRSAPNGAHSGSVKASTHAVHHHRPIKDANPPQVPSAQKQAAPQ